MIAESGEVVHSRLREGRAATGRGAGDFAALALARIRRWWLGEVVAGRGGGAGRLRLLARKVVEACQRHDARFSISVRLQESHHELIAAIPEKQWTPIPY